MKNDENVSKQMKNDKTQRKRTKPLRYGLKHD